MRFDGGSGRDAGGERMKDFILVGKLRKKQTRNCMNRFVGKNGDKLCSIMML